MSIVDLRLADLRLAIGAWVAEIATIGVLSRHTLLKLA